VSTRRLPVVGTHGADFVWRSAGAVAGLPGFGFRRSLTDVVGAP